MNDRLHASTRKIESISDEIVERIERIEDRMHGGEATMISSSRGGTSGGNGDSGDFHGALYRLRKELEVQLRTETDRLSKRFQELQNEFQSFRRDAGDRHTTTIRPDERSPSRH